MSDFPPLYHFSFAAVPGGQFHARVPTHRHPQEDDTIPRICFAPSIEKCLLSKCDGIRCLDNLLLLAKSRNLVATGYLYSLDHNRVAPENLWRPEQVAEFVPDALFTGEHWVVGQGLYCKKSIVVFHGCKYTMRQFGDQTAAAIDHLDYTLIKKQPAKTTGQLLSMIQRQVSSKNLGSVEQILAHPNLLDVLIMRKK